MILLPGTIFSRSQRVGLVVLAVFAAFTFVPAVARAQVQPVAPASARALLADASEDWMWLAASLPVGPGEASQTIVLAKKTGSAQWEGIFQIGAQARSLTHRQNQPVLLLESGQWMFVYTLGRTLGAPAPGGGKLLTLASLGDDLYALAAIPGGIAGIPATEPSGSPAVGGGPRPASAPAPVAPTISTLPTTRPAAPARVVLMQWVDGAWQPRTELANLDPNVPVSMLGAEGRLTIATLGLDGSVLVMDWSGGNLREAAPLRPPQQATDFKVVASGASPIVWVAPATGPGWLYKWKDGAAQDPVELAMPADLSQPVPRDVTRTSRERVRLVFAKGDKVFQQLYDLEGKAVDDVEQVVTSDRRVGEVPQNRWLFAGVMAALAVVFMSAVRRQEAIQQSMQNREALHLAPVARRAAAGVIDLLPYLLAIAIYAPHSQDPEQLQQVWNNPGVRTPLALGLTIYLVHTTAGELLFGRSIGKFLLGLKVVNLRGERARVLGVLLRNVFRLVDIVFFFLPVLMSPLKQRLGDLVAGTLVVLANAPPEADGESAEERNG